MRIATWNVNSVRTRVDRVIDFLARHDIDVLTLQETKTKDEAFPYLAFEAAGYEVAHVGFDQWNGVAIASRVGLEEVAESFPNQPAFAKSGEPKVEARAVGATCAGMRVWSLYVPNGREIADPHYDYKLKFFYALTDHVRAELKQDPAKKLLLTGDFNVAPRDEDVWDISVFEGKTHVSEPERAAFQLLEEAGTREITRELSQQRYTYWDYKSMRFAKDEGMRIDFQLASPTLASTARTSFVDVAERDGKGASDHAPLVVEFAPAYDDVR